MRFEIADDNIAPAHHFAPRSVKHGVGFSHACAHAEKDFEFAMTLICFVALKRGKYGVRIRASLTHMVTLRHLAQDSAPKHLHLDHQENPNLAHPYFRG